MDVYIEPRELRVQIVPGKRPIITVTRHEIAAAGPMRHERP